MLVDDKLLSGSGSVPTSPANRDYKAGFTAAMMLKDLKLAQEAAKASHARHAVGGRRRRGLRAVRREQVTAAWDFSGIIRFLRGVQVEARWFT